MPRISSQLLIICTNGSTEQIIFLWPCAFGLMCGSGCVRVLEMHFKINNEVVNRADLAQEEAR